MAMMQGNKMRYFFLNLVTALVVGLTVFVAALANIVPILGQIVFIAVLIATAILPTITQVLFVMDLSQNDEMTDVK